MRWEERLAQEGYILEGDRAARHPVRQRGDLTTVPPLAWHSHSPHPAPLPLMTSFPRLRLVSESNVASHEHWRHRQQRAKDQRYTVYYGLRCTHWAVPALPLQITLTRIAPRGLDAGNLEACFKHVQDAVADWLAGAEGAGQDRQPGLTWCYAQRTGRPREYAVEVLLEGGAHG